MSVALLSVQHLRISVMAKSTDLREPLIRSSRTGTPFWSITLPVVSSSAPLCERARVGGWACSRLSRPERASREHKTLRAPLASDLTQAVAAAELVDLHHVSQRDRLDLVHNIIGASGLVPLTAEYEPRLAVIGQ